MAWSKDYGKSAKLAAAEALKQAQRAELAADSVDDVIAEVDAVVAENKTRFLNAVATVALRDSTYPNPLNGDTVRVTGTSTTYRFSTGSGWVVTDVYNATAIDNVTVQLADIALNIKRNFNAKGDGISDDTQSIKNAILSGKKVYLPDGKYSLKDANIEFAKGTVLEGQSKLGTEIVVDVADTYQYLFKLNMLTNVRNLTISFVNTFSGSCLLLKPSEISFKNANNNQLLDYYKINNISIKFKWKSGKGTGLDIQIVNYDSNNNVYGSNVAPYLVYFNPDELQVLDGYKGINIYGNQKDVVSQAIWMTAVHFGKLNIISCVYGIYFEIRNDSSTPLLDFGDIRFSNVEIQCARVGYFDDPLLKTIPIYIKGIAARKIYCKFTTLTIWDSVTGDSGYVENAVVDITNFFPGYAPKINTPNYKLGFNFVSATVNIDNDSRIRYTTKTTGNVSEFLPIDGGLSFVNTPEVNGYSARTDVYNIPAAGATTSSLTRIETFDKNSVKIAELKMGLDASTLFKGSSNKCELYVNNLPVVNYGGSNLRSDLVVDRGFFVGMGMYQAFERTTLTIPNAAGYQDVLIPIKELYSNLPFLVSVNLDYADPIGDMSFDVIIRRAAVLDKTTIKLSVKHNKSSSINVTFNVVVCGYKDKLVINT